MEDKPPCEICEHFKDKKGTPTECDKCLPQLLPENELPWKIYSFVAGQLICAGDTPLDVDFRALELVCDMYAVNDKRDMFERIVGLSRHMIKRWNDKKLAEYKKRSRSFSKPVRR